MIVCESFCMHMCVCLCISRSVCACLKACVCVCGRVLCIYARLSVCLYVKRGGANSVRSHNGYLRRKAVPGELFSNLGRGCLYILIPNTAREGINSILLLLFSPA